MHKKSDKDISSTGNNWENNCLNKYLFLDALEKEEVENSMERCNDKQVT